jgi:Cof subfamily protein (haloacid dehalogenase superfamily)
LIKLIAVDLDGTLFNSKSKISSRNALAIRQCLKKGIKITIVSAKSIFAVMNIIRRFKLIDLHVAFGGAAIIDKNNLIQEHIVIPPYYCKKVIKLSRKFDKTICIGTLKGQFNYEKHHRGLKYIGSGGEKLRKCDNLDCKEIIENALLITIVLDKEDKFNDLLINSFKNKLRMVRGGEYFFDISNVGVSKLNGLKNILKTLNIKKSETMAIGDSESDIEMIKFAGIGVAMENSPEEVRNLADYITTSNDNDGAYHIINKIIYNMALD